MNLRILIILGIIAVIVVFSLAYFIPSNKNTLVVPVNTTLKFNQTAMLERGDISMGFNQSMIHHHFMATKTGGEIMIMSTNMSDTKTINEIRSHVKDIQYEFSQGNFTRPFYIHAQVVPGTDIMTAKKNMIQYSIEDIDGGSVLILRTNN